MQLHKTIRKIIINEIASRPGLFVVVDNVNVPNLYMYMQSQTSIVWILIVRTFFFFWSKFVHEY